MANPDEWAKLEEGFQYRQPFQKLNYKLLWDFKRYQPVIETARGCGRGCAFCLENNYLCTPLKSPAKIFEEIREISDLYGTDKLNFYFECSMFNPSPAWAREFAGLYEENRSAFRWRCTTRIDAFNPDLCGMLGVAGLKTIDFGLESASREQLLAMNKTKHPEKYLKQADVLLEACRSAGIWCKLNILLYLGLTKNQFLETYNWLMKRKNAIKGVSVSTYVDYENGAAQPDLSDEISSDYAKVLAQRITDSIMTQQDYIDLKQMCYTDRTA